MPRLNLIYGNGKRFSNASGRPACLDAVATRLDKTKREPPEALSELNRLIGLKAVKELVWELYAYVEVGQWRAREGLPNEATVLHMVFFGNPGTGKTTVARLLARLFKELGVLSKGHLVEVERADLVGEYIGHTAQKTREQVKRALGGILFVDEAYSLARGGEKDFGREAIDTLVRAMEHHRNEFVLILAGYRKEMGIFLRANPGLRSRLPIQIDFPDYTAAELMEIAKHFLAERRYRLSPPAERYLERHLRNMVDSGASAQGNARLVRNLLEKAIRHQAVRLLGKTMVTREDLMTLEPEDFPELFHFSFQTQEGTSRKAEGTEKAYQVGVVPPH